MDIVMICLALAMVIVFILNIKLNVTNRNYKAILQAIYTYKIKCIFDETDDLVDYADMKSMDRAWINMFDWGFKYILPEEQYALVKPFVIPYTLSEFICKNEEERAKALKIHESILIWIRHVTHPTTANNRDFHTYAFALDFINAEERKLLRKYCE